MGVAFGLGRAQQPGLGGDLGGQVGVGHGRVLAVELDRGRRGGQPLPGRAGPSRLREASAITAASAGWPAASSARGSAQRSSTARSALPSSPASGDIGSSCRARSLIRVLRRTASSVSRAAARTRRSNAAWAAPGSSSGASPRGSTSGSRASVSASMPLVLACRDRNRRRSADFWLDTRCTVCPRPAKNTATGSHAGPVGSSTTSNRVPAAAPASAAASTRARLATVGSHRRRHSSAPSAASTRTVCELAIPKSMPTNLRPARCAAIRALLRRRQITDGPNGRC